MKIVIINSLYPPYHRGGAEVVVGTIVNALKKDHEVHILTLRPWGGFSSLRLTTTIQDGVTVHRFFSLNIFSFINIAHHSFFIRAIWHVLDAVNIHSYLIAQGLLGRLKPDLILSHNLKGIGYTIFRAIQKSAIPTIHTVHDVQMIDPQGIVMWGKDRVFTQPSLPYRISMFCLRWIVGSPQRVLFPSRFLRELYERHGFFNDSTRGIVPNPVPDDFFSSLTGEKQLHTPCRFLVVGQVEEHKGIRPLMAALAGVPDLDCTLTIVGDGALSEYVTDCARNDSRIRYLGRLDRSGVKAALNETDYTVVPSLCYENSPMSIYESLSNGVPVIASRIGGVAELVEVGVNGYVVTPGNIEELSAVLQTAAKNSDYETFSHTARQTVKESAVSEYIRKILS